MIQLPEIRKPDSGLFFRCPSWHAIVYEGKTTRLRSLRTADMNEAILRRDKLHAELRADGAVTRSVKARSSAGGKGSYIYERKPFFIRVPGHPEQQAATREEAEAIVADLVSGNDKGLATQPAPKMPEKHK